MLNFNQYFASDADYADFLLGLCMSSTTYAERQLKDLTIASVASDNACSFMISLNGTPAYWKEFLHNILAMVKQIGIPTYFWILSCADLKWKELSYFINRLNLGLSDGELKPLSYQKRCILVNNNPVLLARHFKYNVEIFFK